MLRLLVLASLAAATTAQQRPNILFLFADDMRPDAVRAYGNEDIDTPNLDRLADRGFRFRQNYCMGSRHGAVCAPSRAMLMSGRTLHRVRDDLRGVETLPQVLRAAGYATFATGKWHNQRPPFERSFEQGKAIMFGGMSDHDRVPVVDLDTESRRFVNDRSGAAHSSELFADAAIEFLRTVAQEDRPFFAYVAFTAPHDPRDPPVAYRERYAEREPALPASFRPQHGWNFDLGTLTLRDEVLAGWPREPEVVRDQLREYYGLISHMDAQIGRILQALDASGKADDTIVVFSADHGLAVGSHGLLGKQSLYEHSMGCPLLIAGPSIPAGETRAFTYLLDLYPTLCGFAGVPVPASVEGRDLGPIARGDATSVRDSVFTLYRDSQRAVRDARYKLIRFPKIDKTLLFDLAADPHEIQDLAEEPEHAERIVAMRALLERWQADTGDTQAWTIENPGPQRIDLSGRERLPDGWQPRWIRDKYFDPEPFRVASYNVLVGFGDYRVGDPYRPGVDRKRNIQRWLARRWPDVVALQELNGYTDTRLRREASAWHHDYAVMLKTSGYPTGLTSRWPIEVVERDIDGMHHGIMRCRTGGLDFVVVHLWPFPGDQRLREVERVLAMYRRARDEGREVVILGDFNAVSPADVDRFSDAAMTRYRQWRWELDGDRPNTAVFDALLGAGLVDIHGKHRRDRGELPLPRIDFVLTSPTLAEKSAFSQWPTNANLLRNSDHPPALAGFDYERVNPLGPGVPLRVLAYNVRHGEGSDGELDLERVAAVIRRVDPDLVALQEIDVGVRRTGGVDQPKRLGELCDMHPAFGEFMPYQGGRYGMAVLSRWPIVTAVNHRLPDGAEPRSSLTMRTRAPDGTAVTLAGVHFYRTAEERMAQAEALIEVLADVPDPVIVAGDFNSQPGSPVMTRIARAFTGADKRGSSATFPASRPQREIDFVLFRSDRLHVLDSRVVEEAVASDHRPVLVDFWLRDG